MSDMPGKEENKSPGQGGDYFWKREEEFRLMNDELDAKVSDLLKGVGINLNDPDMADSTLRNSVEGGPYRNKSIAYQWLHQGIELPNAVVGTGDATETMGYKPRLKKASRSNKKSMPEDVLPSTPNEEIHQKESTSSDAAVRVFKLQAHKMQEELQQITLECKLKEDHIKELEALVKELEQEQAKLNKELNSRKQRFEKSQNLLEESKNQVRALESQCTTLKKEIEMLKQSNKQEGATKRNAELHLNRVIEELEKSKVEINQLKQSIKEKAEVNRKKDEHLEGEKRKLEQQKMELIAAFRKQMRLIDILRKQKTHMEASKVLQFTEEEFLRTLDWGS